MSASTLEISLTIQNILLVSLFCLILINDHTGSNYSLHRFFLMASIQKAKSARIKWTVGDFSGTIFFPPNPTPVCIAFVINGSLTVPYSLFSLLMCCWSLFFFFLTSLPRHFVLKKNYELILQKQGCLFIG